MPGKLDFGRRISLSDANSIIKRHKDLIRLVKPVDGITGDLKKEVEEFVNSDYNAFVFDKELISNFLKEKGTENAKYLVVLLGAHPKKLAENLTEKAKDEFKPGSFTVVLTQCDEINGSPELDVVDIKLPALEYPPKKVTVILKK